MAVPSKEAFLYVFDRVTGKPVWPIVERPVPQRRRAGRVVFADAAVPDQASGLCAPGHHDGRTDRLHAGAACEGGRAGEAGTGWVPCSCLRWSARLAGRSPRLTIGTLGGGTNWPGAGYDPETHTVFAQAANAGVSPLGLVEPPPGFSDIRYLAGVAGQTFRVNEGPGFGSGVGCAEGQRDPGEA